MNMDELLWMSEETPEDMEKNRIGTQNKFKFKYKGPDNPDTDWWDANILLNNDDEERYIFDMRVVATEDKDVSEA